MTQLKAHEARAKQRLAENDGATRAGLFLVKPTSKLHVIPASEPRIARRSRSLGLTALGAAAFAAPLLWFLHEALVSAH